MHVSRPERSLAELFSDLSQQTGELIRQEMQLAKAELSGKVAELTRGALVMGAGAALALTALLAVAASVVLLLVNAGLEPWVAALVAALLFAVTGLALIATGIAAFKRHSLSPEKTIDSLKETAQWLKNETK